MKKVKFFKVSLIIASILGFGSCLHAVDNLSQKRVVSKKIATPTQLIKEWETERN